MYKSKEELDFEKNFASQTKGFEEGSGAWILLFNWIDSMYIPRSKLLEIVGEDEKKGLGLTYEGNRKNLIIEVRNQAKTEIREKIEKKFNH